MPRLETYRNHEMMNITSELMRTEFALHELEGGEYDDDTTKQMAQRVIFSCMPHIADFLQQRVIVEAPKAHLLDNDDPRPIEGLHVEAKFKNIEFQPVLKKERLEGFMGSLLLQDYDLFAVVRPQYHDPEPDEIVFGDEVMVPFGEVTLFEPSERRAA